MEDKHLSEFYTCPETGQPIRYEIKLWLIAVMTKCVVEYQKHTYNIDKTVVLKTENKKLSLVNDDYFSWTDYQTQGEQLKDIFYDNTMPLILEDNGHV